MWLARQIPQPRVRPSPQQPILKLYKNSFKSQEKVNVKSIGSMIGTTSKLPIDPMGPLLWKFIYILNLKFWDFLFEKLCVSLMSCFKTMSLVSRVDDLRQNMSEHPGGPRAIVKGYVREGKGKLEAGIAAEER